MAGGKLKLNEQKRQHRERAQPAHRKKLGLLEKHADYVKRARDFHSKEDRIQKLREKASMRNKDEFYFGMIRSKTAKGVHVQSRGNEALPMDLVKVLKTQDAGYIRSQAKMEQGRVERLQQQLDALVDDVLPSASTSKAGGAGEDDETMMDEDDWDMYDDEPVAPKRNHIVFTDSLDAVRSADPSSLLRKRSTPTALPSSANPAQQTAKQRRKGKGKAVAQEEAELREERAREVERVTEEAKAHRTALTAEISARQDRLLQLQRAARELDLQRALMSKGAKESIVRPAGDGKKREEEWWLGGGKKGTEDGAGRGGLSGAEEGVGTGARVWKWKAVRKR
ncbi:hypothetical protein JCM8097_004024 [Rhodosporidiobolus ruineniae]